MHCFTMDQPASREKTDCLPTSAFREIAGANHRGTSLIRTTAPPLGLQRGPRHGPTVGSKGGAVSYGRGIPAVATVAPHHPNFGAISADFWRVFLAGINFGAISGATCGCQIHLKQYLIPQP